MRTKTAPTKTKAQNTERVRAHRLRKASNTRPLTRAEGSWLAAYDKAHPAKASAFPDAAPAAQPEEASRVEVHTGPPTPEITTPGAAQLEAVTGELAAPDEHAPASLAPLAPLGAAAAEATAAPAANVASFGNASIAALLTGMFVAELPKCAAAMGTEIPAEVLPKIGEAYMRSTLNTLDRYWPDTAASAFGDIAVAGTGTAIVLGGPKLRAWIEEKQKNEIASPAPTATVREEVHNVAAAAAAEPIKGGSGY